MKHIGSFAFAAMMIGCASLQPMPDVRRMDDGHLCGAYHYYGRYGTIAHTEAVHDEIQRRNLLSKEDWQLVYEKSIRIGIRSCVLYAAWGSPDSENRSTGAWGTGTQHVYGRGRYARYVYTRNGRVTGWQD